jgi:hypothetical protein
MLEIINDTLGKMDMKEIREELEKYREKKKQKCYISGSLTCSKVKIINNDKLSTFRIKCQSKVRIIRCW